MPYTKTTWSTGDVITATKLNNLETQHEKILGEANTYTATPTFSTGAILGGNISSTGSITAMIDSDNDGTSSLFGVRANGSATDIWSVSETGSQYMRGSLTRASSAGNASILADCFSAASSTHVGQLILAKSASNTFGTRTLLNSGDDIGEISFQGANGTTLENAARIRASVDGTPSSTSMPARLSFFTTPDSSLTPIERIRINNSGGTIFKGPAGSMPSAPLSSFGTHVAEFYNAGSCWVNLHRESADANAAVFAFMKRRSGLTTAIASSDSLGLITWTGPDGTNMRQSAQIEAIATGTWSGTSLPSKIEFRVTASGSTSITKRLEVNSNGIILDGINSFGNSRDAYVNSTASSIYATVSTGAAYPFNQAGHLVLEPRFSGATRDVVALKSDGTANLIAYGAGGAKVNGAFETTGLITATSGINPNSSGGQSITVYKEETATLTLTGMTATVTTQANITQVGRQVSIQVEPKTGTSNSTALTLTGLPSAYYPTANSGNIEAIAIVVNSGNFSFGRVVISTTGTITLYTDAAVGAFTNSGDKGVQSLNVVYSIV